MRICHDCFTVNRSHLSYCQKCSGELTNNQKPYLTIRIVKRNPRRVPAFLLRWLKPRHAG